VIFKKAMKNFKYPFILILFLLTGLNYCIAQIPPVQLLQAFPNLTFTSPVFLTHSSDGTNRIFVVQQNGLIKVFPNDSNITNVNVNTFLDISNKISASSGEEGLLGLAFHQSYISNGYFYINYTAPGPLRTVISRFKISQNNPNKADSLSEYKILQINQPYTNHNGGCLMFGLDGFLYIGMGDGGSGGDPQNNAQNTHVLLGKMLRIDVNDTTANTRYKIPVNNPFYNDTASGKGEIFSWGLRNPWRFSQDAVTSLIYCGDVGQGIWEEIDLIQNGKNYGWRVLEGFVCYNPSSGCDTAGKTMPIKAYNHTGGACSVTGGYVYRGSRRPELQGAYIYGDYCNGKIWMLRYNNGNVTADSLIATLPSALSSFGQDQSNELYMLGYSNGKIYRFNKSSVNNIITISNNIPQSFELMQNYPNPFNPKTNIGFKIRNKGSVSLKVFDVNGKEVAILVNENLNPGFYSVNFNAVNLSSGIYYYRLESGNSSDSKKMLLLK
jgi:glucose/arabinose dehydrogenase